ncbi:Tetratricopeptide repeat protein [Sulfidibacter corallicola]|uniref:Tetratricopeptide repeat protein n=1 Tax=Sulfidibacter corallicola TaxID=2818388 RepID=A0A8A4TS21_SULCO|nr:tetratricopeptide repeat protein [Sulfidibacter corallicola]QTD52187.1 tetratricopeptide repeat protein [Sulfidibacter corallicola]
MGVDLRHFDDELQQILLELKENPENVELLAKVCYEFNIRSYHNLCITYARRGLAKDPFHASLYYELIIASSLDTAHILEEILTELEGILESRPGDVGARRNLALTHYFMENDEEAERMLRDILHGGDEENGDRQSYEILAQLEYAHGHFDGCIDCCEKAIAQPGPAARATRLKGMCHQELGQQEEAMSAYTQALEMEPHFVWACHSFASLHFERGDFKQAMRYFGKATYTNPNDPGNLFLLAEAFMDMEAYDLAMGELTKLLMCKPIKRIEAEVYNALGYLWIKKGDPDRARQNLTQAIELEPELAVAYFNMGLLAQKEHNFPLAERHFKNAIAIDSQNMDAWVELGFLNIQQKKYDQAEECFQTVLDLDPDEAQAYLGLSKLCQREKDADAQLETAQRAYELDPDHPEICNNLGIAYECNMNFEQAEDAYTRALELDPFHSPAANNLGYLYEKKIKLLPSEENHYRKKAIEAWTKRLQICVVKKKSIKGATTHLLKLGLTQQEIDALSEAPYQPES